MKGYELKQDRTTYTSPLFPLSNLRYTRFFLFTAESFERGISQLTNCVALFRSRVCPLDTR